MKTEFYDEKELFIKRLTQLRMEKDTSARDMSLSLGRSESYINNIENGVSMPSMDVFFDICDYFKITPQEFFDYEIKSPKKVQRVAELSKRLSGDQLEILAQVIKQFK